MSYEPVGLEVPPEVHARILHPVLVGKQARRALAERDISAVYRLLCGTETVDQQRIAALVGQTQSEVSEILNGRKVMKYELLERIADGLGVPRGWMGLGYTDAHGRVAAYSASGEADTIKDDDMRRRHLLSLGSLAALGLATPAAAWEPSSAVLTDTMMDAAPLTADTVTAMTGHFTALDHQYGGLRVHDAVSRTAQALTGRAREQGATDPDLLSALGNQHGRAAWTAVDCAAYDRAWWHFEQALELARRSGDTHLAVRTLNAVGRMELIRGNANEALKFFQLAGSRGARHDVTMATAYAELDMREDAGRELDRSRTDWAGTVHAAGVEGQAGHTLLRLGEYEQAAAALDTVLMARGAGEARARCQESASLAAAHLQAGNMAAGIGAAEESMRLVSTLRSTTARHSLRPLYQAASEKRDSTCQDLAERLRKAATVAA